jgi:hypothetical protein
MINPNYTEKEIAALKSFMTPRKTEYTEKLNSQFSLEERNMIDIFITNSNLSKEQKLELIDILNIVNKIDLVIKH